MYSPLPDCIHLIFLFKDSSWKQNALDEGSSTTNTVRVPRLANRRFSTSHKLAGRRLPNLDDHQQHRAQRSPIVRDLELSQSWLTRNTYVVQISCTIALLTITQNAEEAAGMSTILPTSHHRYACMRSKSASSSTFEYLSFAFCAGLEDYRDDGRGACADNTS
jgi:hypothetical protein